MFSEPDASGKCYLENTVLAQLATDVFNNGSTFDIFKKVWIRLLKVYDNKKGIKWTWQSLDSHIHKVAFRGAMTGNNPMDRSKLGTKRHILTDKKGIRFQLS